MLLAAIAVVLVLSMGALCYWQVARALSGNTLSWAYVFEWPLFAGYVVYMWWRLSHERIGGPAAHAEPPAVAGGAQHAVAGDAEVWVDDEVDDELAAYNRYLASLEQSGRRKRW